MNQHWSVFTSTTNRISQFYTHLKNTRINPADFVDISAFRCFYVSAFSHFLVAMAPTLVIGTQGDRICPHQMNFQIGCCHWHIFSVESNWIFSVWWHKSAPIMWNKKTCFSNRNGLLASYYESNFIIRPHYELLLLLVPYHVRMHKLATQVYFVALKTAFLRHKIVSSCRKLFAYLKWPAKIFLAYPEDHPYHYAANSEIVFSHFNYRNFWDISFFEHILILDVDILHWSDRCIKHHPQ